MNDNQHCHLLVDPPADGAWNMALDEALLLAAEREGSSWLRFYTWQHPTLSLGYFQTHADRQLHPPSATCHLVRRASGGGAILHHLELTYSIALPSHHPLARHPQFLYDAAHRSLIETLAEWGISARQHVDERPLSQSAAESRPPARTPQPFLCFQRHTPGDVLIGEHKIAGSAQRRRQGAVLQHGSILLVRSEFAPELPGIFDISNYPAQKEDDLRLAWQSKLATRLGLNLRSAAVPPEIASSANAIFAEKFSSSSWTYRR